MDGLALYLGEGYEFVLHSLEDLSHSVVKIINGHYSNRKPGAPITDFGLNLLRDLEQKQKPEPQVYFNYQNGTLLKSTTIPILGDNGRMIAMLCINFHTDIPMATFLSGFFPAGSPSPLPQRSETFSDNVDHFIHAPWTRPRPPCSPTPASPPSTGTRRSSAWSTNRGSSR